MDALKSAWRRVILRQPQQLYSLAGDEELMDVEGNGAPKPKAPGAAAASKPGGAPGASSLWATHREEILSLLPYLWPKEEPKLKVFMVLAFVCLLSAKLFNILVPLALKRAVDNVAEGKLPINAVLCYGFFRFLTDSSKEGRDCFFNYASTYASRKISLRVFNHVQSLSLRFHLNRKTGAVLRAVSRGSAAYADLLRYLTFQIMPIFLEVGLVSAYLFARYSPAFGLITITVMTVYVASTIIITEWRNKYRRMATEADDAFNQKAVDALINYETCMYFCLQDHISDVYDESLKAVAYASIDSQLSLSLLNLCQNAVISIGVALAMGIAGKEVVQGKMTVGDFVVVQVFILQLYAPLGFLGTYWRMIKAALVDVEAMFKLLHEGQEVADLPNAQELVVGKSADVRFEDVVFTFEPKMGPILKGVSLEARAGQKLAVVGASGAGKSTLARLLYRLYNVEKGRILISGMDIATCTQRSVRLAVGIVPQDCCLFNDTLRYNISIGKLARGELASDEEVASATAAAQLSDFVARQPQRFDTVVGERGLRLSGGEKQRVAIARALLKQPAVLACDEATSALDSHTEKEITEAMNRAAVGRTYIVIAHRLSTIADADIIAVLDQGLIAEAGTHAELLARNGLYASMWQKHQREGASRSESTASLAALAT